MANGPDPRIEYRRARSGSHAARLRELIKREGTHICCYCGYNIDMTLPPSSPMGWTMEHIIPLDIDPSLGLDPANIREAHRRCNSIRGTGIPRPRVIGSRRW